MRLLAAHALLPSGWARNVAIDIGDDGLITKIVSDTIFEKMVSETNFVVPGMANLHSHAFQRAMAGLTEARTRESDTFWTWRDLMYRLAARITPEQMGDIAAYLYMEMLKAGYTSVAEFHYLHRAADGAMYQDPAQMSQRLIAAAREAGIAITHLPVLYAYGGFGAQPATPDQSRFILSGPEYEELLAQLRAMYGDTRDVRIGAAFHSLRAIDEKLLRSTLDSMQRIDPTAPIHIHIAEQQAEVDACLAWSGARPVTWLLDHAPVDARWCLVHATHLDAAESNRLAASGAVAGLCPTTEANLGDGIFPAAEFLSGSNPGRIGIGSDSHVSVSVAEELRLLEYGQRLTHMSRATLASDTTHSPGERLHFAASNGGAQALGIQAGRIAPGCRADLVVLDPEHPALWNKSPAQVLDAWIFAGDNACVRDVMVGGEWRIQGRWHAREEALARRFRAAQAALLA
ncbi:MAG: formimidoylglutamate deiminase [Usitatibacter sp.]